MERTTIYDIARLAGVSPSTVSRALNNHPSISEKTKEKVWDAQARLAYVPDIVAKGLSGQKTCTVGVIVTDISNPYLYALCAAIERNCAEFGYRVLLSNTLYDPRYELDTIGWMLSQRVDGLLISACSPLSQEQHSRQIGGLPCVYLGNNHSSECSYVEVDNEKGAYDATQYLYQLGHRRIAFLGGRKSSRTFEFRRDGYCRSLSAHGLEPRVFPAPESAGDMQECLYYSALEIFRRELAFDGIIAFNDVTAMTILDAAGQCGLYVPEDFSIIGFDNAVFSPLPGIQLTSVSQQAAQAGRLAVERLMSQINGGGRTADTLQPELMIRNSCRRR